MSKGCCFVRGIKSETGFESYKFVIEKMVDFVNNEVPDGNYILIYSFIDLYIQNFRIGSSHDKIHKNRQNEESLIVETYV